MNLRTKETCGADEKTPSRSEYFTWLNNTNEGSNEEQTLANLAFFAYLKRTYGMELDIYAWDAGNLDGASKTYADFSKGKLKKQYPNGYQPIVDYAKSIGTRMGVWGGTDGYGDTPEEENARRELLVSLCRDYNFALFKFDRVCGKLRPEKRPAFAKTMVACRKYSPDLILLLHRNKVGKEYIYATTDLWQRKETYVDGNSWNLITAPHHRSFAFTRGLTPGLSRLLEDHGVCISSFPDYFEDDMIMQAFGRCLILAPEIYGNPFFVRDDEYAIMARIFNLHRRYRDILVNGLVLPEGSYGKNAVSRGDENRRFLVLSNPTWQEKEYCVTINEEIGLSTREKYSVIQRFPTEGLVKIASYGEKVKIAVKPFRACLLEVVKTNLAEMTLSGCEYLTLHENGGIADRVKIVKSSGKIHRQIGEEAVALADVPAFDATEKAPVFLGSMSKIPTPKFARRLYEAAMFSASNDSMELQAIKRSGASKIPEVNRARELFFNQETYKVKGTDSCAMFDGDKDSFFDSELPRFIEVLRICGGCLRVDLGDEIYASKIEIEYFNPSENIHKQTPPQSFNSLAEYSTDLDDWTEVRATKDEVTDAHFTSKVVVERVNNIAEVKGEMHKITFSIGGPIRYFTLPSPMYRIHSFKALGRDGKEVNPEGFKGNILMAPYSKKATKSCRKAVVHIPENATSSFLAVAVNGYHGKEGVYCAATLGGKTYGMDDRAPAYHVNCWQHEVVGTSKNNTFYLEITDEMRGKDMEVYALFNRLFTWISSVDIYLCSKHIELKGKIIEL